MEQSFSVIEWGWVRVKHLSTSKVKASDGAGKLSFVSQQSPRDHGGQRRVQRVLGHTHTHTHVDACRKSHHAPCGMLFITGVFYLYDNLDMWIRRGKQHKEEMIKKAINCVTVEMRDTYPLLLCGYKSLEAGGHAEAQLVNKRGLRLAVDLHSHTCLEGCILWKGDRWKGPVSWFIQSINKQKQKCARKNKLWMSFGFSTGSDKPKHSNRCCCRDFKTEFPVWNNLLAMNIWLFNSKLQAFKIVFIITHSQKCVVPFVLTSNTNREEGLVLTP